MDMWTRGLAGKMDQGKRVYLVRFWKFMTIWSLMLQIQQQGKLIMPFPQPEKHHNWFQKNLSLSTSASYQEQRSRNLHNHGAPYLAKQACHWPTSHQKPYLHITYQSPHKYSISKVFQNRPLLFSNIGQFACFVDTSTHKQSLLFINFFSDTEWWPLSPYYFWFIVTCRTFTLSRLFRVWGYAFLPLLCQPSHSFRTTHLTHIFKISKPPLTLVFSSPWCWLWNVLQSQSSNTNRSKLSRLGKGYEKSVYTFVSVHMESFIYISLLSTDNSVSCYLT